VTNFWQLGTERVGSIHHWISLPVDEISITENQLHYQGSI
jgi:hypothetical protein